MSAATVREARESIADARTHVDLLVGRAIAIAASSGEHVQEIAQLASELDTNLGGADSFLKQLEVSK